MTIMDSNLEDNDHFSQAVAQLLMAIEELRRSLAAVEIVTTDHVMQWQQDVDMLLPILDTLARWTDDAADEASVEAALFMSCQQKAVSLLQQVLNKAYLLKEPDEDDPNLTDPIDVVRQDGQAAVARFVEVLILLLETAKARNLPPLETTTDAVVESYVSYQRQVIRARAKPAIAHLVHARRQGLAASGMKLSSAVATAISSTATTTLPHTDSDDPTDIPTVVQYHAPALASILGQAAAFIHPLQQWQTCIPEDHPLFLLCSKSITTVDKQAQELVQTVSSWFMEDKKDWFADKQNDDDCLDARQLGLLDGLVEEMAFGCQVQARYVSLCGGKTIEKEILPEWTWKYALLERYLAMKQWQMALIVAAPVHIVLGTNVQVPSVVEDAQFLSIRALERAALVTWSAIGTVAHAVSSDVWSTEVDSGVHHALLEQRGCWVEPKHCDRDDNLKSSTGFASALLDALDEDLKHDPRAGLSPHKSPTKPPSAPTSANFLSAIVSGGVGSDQSQQMQLDTDLCLLNGIHAACGACRSLVLLLDTLISDGDETGSRGDQDEKTMSMIQLAREELFRFTDSYKALLTQRINLCLETWCGSIHVPVSRSSRYCLHWLKLFFEDEDYNLDAKSYAQAESDGRLEHDMIEPLRESRLLSQLADKCETDVLHQTGAALVSLLVELVLDALWKGAKHFTDWGSLLLSKQVRTLQSFCSSILSNPASELPPPNLLPQWERLSQVVSVLQVEKPSDWLAYQSILTPSELDATLRLRVDFSRDAIQAVVTQVASKG